MSNKKYWSRLEKFYQLPIDARRNSLSTLDLGLISDDFHPLDHALSHQVADCMSENVIGSFSLPFAVAPNFLIDNQPCLVPMVSEEPSVVAAASKMAKLVGMAGGFTTEISRSLIKGQVQIYNFTDTDRTFAILMDNKSSLISYLSELCPNMERRGGGVVALDFRKLKSPTIGAMIIIEPTIDVVDAMGANVVNTMMEKLATKISALIDCTIGLRILSNLCDQRLAHGRCAIPFGALAGAGADTDANATGIAIAKKMVAAQAFAEADPYRACTHNKGVLNGIDAVAIATGNDFRAIEAGAHAYACRSGSYLPLTDMRVDGGAGVLQASLTLPLAVGVVGGSCAIHGGVRLAKKILGAKAASSKVLSSVMVSVGLAQCLAALYALSCDGIQKGHMKLHNRRAKITKGVK